MLLAVDANVIFSSLIRKGNSFKVFEANKIFKKFNFIAPEFLFDEINKKTDRIVSLTQLKKEELFKILDFIKDQTDFIPYSEFIDKLSEAREINYKDSPYVALALKFNCPIFSGDKKLKERNKVEVFSPRELLDILGIG